MADRLSIPESLELWRRVVVETVRRDQPDLSARQQALLLTVYLQPPPHTVRGLAGALNVSKPAITRALDRLAALGLVRRASDEADKRNVLVERTPQGLHYLRDFAAIVVAAAPTPPPEPG
jgi:DNA-binding MarR family transcriptional regulator